MRTLLKLLTQVTCVGVLLAWYLPRREDLDGVGQMVVLAVLIYGSQLGVRAVWFGLDHLLGRFEQEREDHHARRVVKRVLAGSRTRFVLCIRSFSTDGTLTLAAGSSKDLGVLDPRHYALGDIGLERLLRRTLRERGYDAVMMGSNVYFEGPGRVELEHASGWEELFYRLAPHAFAFVCIAGSTPSLMAELNHLRDHGWLSRCVFIAVGAESFAMVSQDLKRAGFGVPPVCEALVFFTLSASGALERQFPVSERTPAAFRKGFAQAFDSTVGVWEPEPYATQTR